MNTREVSALLRELDKTMTTKASLMTRLRKGRAALWRFLKKHKITIVGGVAALLLAVLALHWCKKKYYINEDNYEDYDEDYYEDYYEGGSGDNDGSSAMERVAIETNCSPSLEPAYV